MKKEKTEQKKIRVKVMRANKKKKKLKEKY